MWQGGLSKERSANAWLWLLEGFVPEEADAIHDACESSH